MAQRRSASRHAQHAAFSTLLSSFGQTSKHHYRWHNTRSRFLAVPPHINKSFPPIQMSFHVNMLAFVQNSALSYTDDRCQPLYMKVKPDNTMTKQRLPLQKAMDRRLC